MRITGDLFFNMKILFLFFLALAAVHCYCQEPGFRKLYSGDSTGASFTDIVWNGERLIVTGQFLTDTAPNNALNGLLYMELDTNGNPLFTDIYYHPNDAVTPELNNSLYFSGDYIYSMGQVLGEKSSYMAIYQNSERINTVIYPVEGFVSFLEHCVRQENDLFLTGSRQNYQYESQGMLIKTTAMGDEKWRKFYGIEGRNCGIAEPYHLDENTIILPGFKGYDPQGQVISIKSWMIAVDSLGNKKWEWESPNNAETGPKTRILRMPNGNWLYSTTKIVFNPNIFDATGFQPKIVCRDENFNLLWEKNIPVQPTIACYTIDIQPTSDGNYILVGYKNNSLMESGEFIYKFAPNGDKIWMHQDLSGVIENKANLLGGVVELPGGSIVAAGYSIDYDQEKVSGLIIKLDRNGCQSMPCVGSSSSSEPPTVIPQTKVSPNPATDFVTIEGTIGDYIDIFDLTGKVIQSEKITGTHQEIKISELLAGTYLLRMQDKSSRVTVKLIKQ